MIDANVLRHPQLQNTRVKISLLEIMFIFQTIISNYD